MHSKTTQRNKQIAMGRKKFNMDPKKVSGQPRARLHVLFTDIHTVSPCSRVSKGSFLQIQHICRHRRVSFSWVFRPL